MKRDSESAENSALPAADAWRWAMRRRTAACFSRASFRRALRRYLVATSFQRLHEVPCSGNERKLAKVIVRLLKLEKRPPNKRHFFSKIRRVQKIFHRAFPSQPIARRCLLQFWERDRQCWQPGRQTISFTGRTVRLSVVPAWKFLGPLPEDGEGGPIFGISPAHDDSLHLVNGWLASVEGDDLPPLRFVRHGHLRGWPRIHVTAKPSPAVAELLNLALRCQERVEKDLADRPTADGKPRNVALRIASLQLMTAGARSWLCDGDRPGEQHREWERVEKLGVSIQFSQNPTDQPQPLLLRPKVLSFNFPVNPWFHRLGGVRLLGWMPIPDDPSLSLMASTDAAFHVLLGKNCADGEAGPGRWHISRCQDWQEICKKCGPNGRVEEAALRLWDEDSLVGAALRDGARTDRERWQILQLARQVLGLCQLTKRRSSVFLPRRALRSYENFCHCGNPYAMPARVFLLCHMLGIPCACNCRSGKDRTGIFHGEVAYLWLRMHCDEAGTVPEPWSAAKNLDWQERLDRVRVLDACGSGHILTSCTGFYGYRVQDDRWWMRALLKFPFLEKFYGPVIGASWLAES